jgi:uncharacterized protein YfaS (alpha-2-macroglobulin family)
MLVLMLPAVSLTAKTKSKADLKKEFNKGIKKSCYTANNVFYRLRYKLNKKEKPRYWYRLARCFRETNPNYPHYTARNYYYKLLRPSGVPYKWKLEARFFMAWYQVRYVYYYNSSYYRRRRKKFEKTLAKLERDLNQRGYSVTSRWFGELQLLRMRYYKRLRRYNEAWQLSRTLLVKGYPSDIQGRALMFAAQQIVYSYQPPGYPSNYRARRVKVYRELLTKVRSRKHKAHTYYLLANESRYQGDKGFEESLTSLRKGVGLKAGRWSASCKQLLETLTTPRMTPMFPMQLKPNKSQKLTIHLSRIREATFTLYRADLQKVFRKYNSIFALQDLKLRDKVLSQKLKLDKNIKLNYNYGYNKPVKMTLNGLPAGSYVIELTGTNRYKRGSRVRMPLLVSNAQLILKQARKKLLVAMVDGRTSKPMVGAKLTYTIGRRNPFYLRYYYRRRYRRYPHLRKKKKWKKLKVNTATMNAEGLFRRSFKKVKYNRQVNIMACLGKSCTMGQSGQYRSYGPYRYYYYSWYYYRRLQHKLFWTTDRGAYRPGQTVFFKGIYHRQRYLKWESAKGLRVRVIVRDSKGKNLYKKLFTLAELGTFDGTFKLKQKAPLGVYNVTLQMLYRRKNYSYVKRTFYKKFRVEEYRRPKFVVRTVLKPGVFAAGNKLKWKISAKYTFGGPVKNAKVRWTLRREYANPKFSFPRPFAYYFKPQQNYGYRRYYRYRRRYYRYHRHRYGSNKYYYNYYKRLMQRYRRYMRMYSNSSYYRRWYKKYRRMMLKYAVKVKPLAQGTGRLNGKGELHITTPSKSDSGYYKYVLTAEVTDVSRRTIAGSGSTVLGKLGGRAYIRTTKMMVLPGEKVKVLLRTLRPDNQGVATKGKLYLVRSSKKRGELRDIADQTITVKTNAEGKAVVRFFADYLGHFRIVFVGELPNGQKVKTETAIWLGSDKLKDTNYAYKRLEIVTDRDLYKIGQTASVLINTPRVPDSFLVTVEGEGLFWSSQIKAKGRSTVAQLPVLASFAPNVWVTVTHMYKGVLYTAQRRIVVPPTHKFLNIAVTPFKKDYRPGEKVKWKVKVTDKKGRPVKSNLLLFAYDKSLDLIGKVDLPNIQKSFYDRQQSRGVATVASINSMANYRNKLRRYDFASKSVMGGVTRGAGGVGYGKRGRVKLRAKRMRRQMVANDSAAPAPPPAARRAPMKSAPVVVSKKSKARSIYRPQGGKLDKDSDSNKPGQPLAKARKRTDFRETAVWLSSVNTNSKGEAVVSFRWPDSLTSWSVRAVVVGKGVKIGAIQKVTRTNQKLMAQIAAPRFFTVGDKAKVAVVAFNRSKRQRVRVKLKVKGLKLLGSATRRGWLKAGENKRFVFEVTATVAGKVSLSAEVASSEAADAVEVKRSVEAFGLDRYASSAGSIFGKGKSGMAIRLPSVFSKGSGRLEIAVSSSLTRSIFDSLGYLVKFPYGCVEQTMSRFLPASLVAKTLTGLDKSDPKLAKKLPKVIKAGLERLYNFQHDDGGWGWWQHDNTNDFMTAYVIFGLSTAKSSGYKIDGKVLSRGAAYLKGRVNKLRSNPALHAYALYALSLVGKIPSAEIDHSLSNIKKLNSYGLALLSLAYSRKGDASSASYVLKRLHARLTSVQGGEQAYFPGKGTLRGWAEDGVEATAVALRALIEAKAYKKDWPRIARWLLNNRKGKRWRSTRDTAQAILALSSFATAVGDGKGTRKVQVLVNGRVLKTVTLTANDARNNGLSVVLNDARLRKGVKYVSVRNLSKGPIYYGIQLKYRTEETNIPAGGSGILSIRRAYYKVIRRGSSVRFRRIRSGQPVKAGTEVEVRLTIRGKNKLSYLLFADRKPAGLEPVKIKSGAPMLPWLSHQEFRDTHVAFFAGTLKRNQTYKLKYRMRAERPGRYRTLPTVGGPMYVPKANGHSSSFVFVITP